MDCICEFKLSTVAVQEKNIELLSEVLFTTEDGVDIHEYDYVHGVTIDFISCLNNVSKYWYERVKSKFLIFFSTSEKCDEYILMNKPLLSLNDLLSVWGNGKPVGVGNTPLFNNFKELATSKLNNK